MRFLASFVAVLYLSLLSSAKNGPKPNGCNPHARGPHLEKQQQAAMRDFAHLLINENDPLTAFNRYVPGLHPPRNREYIQHNPFALSGREIALEFLISARETGGFTATNLTSFAGEGYGFTHIRATWNGVSSSVMDYFRFEGTCIVEHWDVAQVITGNETNPIAFF